MKERYREFELIEKISSAFPSHHDVVVSIGDDCAVLNPNARIDLVTTDTLVEGIHFRRDWSSPYAIGWKSLAVSLSDIAAMGGTPSCFFLNLSLGPQDDKSFVDAFIGGMKDAARKLVPDGLAITLAGGDTTVIDGPSVFTVTLMGTSAASGPITRSGASSGDFVVLLGPTGSAAGGLDILNGIISIETPNFEELLQAHRMPTPRVQAGMLLGASGIISAMIDVSDGLVQDLAHIARASHLGAVIYTENLPAQTSLSRLCQIAQRDIRPYILSGGDDYELLLTIPPQHISSLNEITAKCGLHTYIIGEMVESPGDIQIIDDAGKPYVLEQFGFTHF